MGRAEWSIHSQGRQRKLLNWFVLYQSVLHLRPQFFYRYRWDFTSGAIVITGPALVTDDMPSVNGCSMKTEANLTAVKAIPPGKIMFETGPYIPDPRHKFTP